MNIEYPKSKEIIDLFNFLEQNHGFEIMEDRSGNSGIFLAYGNPTNKVIVVSDFREYLFHVVLVKGRHTQYPNEEDTENIKMLWNFINKFSLCGLSIQDMQPKKGEDYKKVVKLNAKILEKYGGQILSGEDWL